jgi:hypothetical protein
MYSNGTLETVRGCVSLKKEKSQGKDVEVTGKKKILRLLSDFVQEFGPRTVRHRSDHSVDCYFVTGQCVPERKVSDVPFRFL